MRLTVEAVKPLQKSMAFKAGGVEYMTKKDSGIAAGMVIETEPELSEYNGKEYRWVKKYKVVNGDVSGGVSGSVSGTAWLPMASNLTAHAINAGLIKGPEEVKVWILATKQAYEEACQG